MPLKSETTKTEKPIGEVTHFYDKIGVAIVKFNKEIGLGIKIRFKGATTDFESTIDSMQFDHKPVEAAKKNQEVGIKVKERVREGDGVFKA